jgi:hypothetical protein
MPPHQSIETGSCLKHILNVSTALHHPHHHPSKSTWFLNPLYWLSALPGMPWARPAAFPQTSAAMSPPLSPHCLQAWSSVSLSHVTAHCLLKQHATIWYSFGGFIITQHSHESTSSRTQRTSFLPQYPQILKEPLVQNIHFGHTNTVHLGAGAIVQMSEDDSED